MEFRTEVSTPPRVRLNGREVKDPKQKRNLHIFISFFLAFFVVALVFALVMLIRQSTTPGELVFTYSEEVHVEEVTYKVKVIARDEKYSEPQNFRVVYRNNGYNTIPDAEVTDFETTKSGSKTTYTFTIQILGEDWDNVQGISFIEMTTAEGSYNIEGSQDAENIWIAYVVIGVFIVVLSTLIAFNIKWTIIAHKEAQAEIIDKITATQKAVAENATLRQQSNEQTTNENNAQTQNNKKSKNTELIVECPYCHLKNKLSDSKCTGCNAPLR